MNVPTCVEKPQLVSRVSYAQNMEDILLDRLFHGRMGTFVDVGANHPVFDSNTYFFYLRGWRGVNLEPNPELTKLFLEQRPGDTNLAVAASDVDGILPFYEVVDSSGLSTLSAEVAGTYRRRGYQVRERQIPVRTVASLIEEHRIPPPDILSIDVESHEGQVIRGIPLAAWRPKVLVVEATLPMSEVTCHEVWEALLLERGYLFAAFNGVNRFYLREDLRDQLDSLRTPVNVLDHYRRHETVAREEDIRRLQDDVVRVQGAWAADLARFEETRTGWDWARAQAEQACHAWDHERAAYERERAAWHQAQEQSEAARVELIQQKEAAQQELESLRCSVEQQERELREMLLDARDQLLHRDEEVQAVRREAADLQRRIEELTEEKQELRELLLDAHNQLLNRDDEIQATLTAVLPPNGPVITGAIASSKFSRPSKKTAYAELVRRLGSVVEEVLPAGATVLVVSKGDDELLRLGDRRTGHFPQNDQGTYAGHYPADGAAAIGHLETLRARGAQYLLFPTTSLWWLDHYPTFREHLESRYRLVLQREDTCTVYELQESDQGGSRSVKAPQQQYLTMVQRIRDLVRRRLPAPTTLLVISKGDEELLRLEPHRGWHFPQQLKTGTYAGHYPANSEEAIQQLKELRARGAQFLVIPATALWWLDHYPDFRHYLESLKGIRVDERETCAVFDLRDRPSQEGERLEVELLRQVQEVVDRRLPPGATVAVLSKGDERLLQLGGRRAGHFPQGPDGEYAGPPVSNEAAIAHLEELRAQGVDHLLVPVSALGWLEHYGEFRLHLEKHYRIVVRHAVSAEQDICIIYALRRFQKGPVAPRPLGVNVAGNFASEKGVGEAVRSTVRALQAANVPHVLNNFADPTASNPDRAFGQFSEENPYAINLVQVNADAVPEFVWTRGEPYLQGRYNIGYWFWELSELPRDWDSSFQYFDEIWTASNFVHDAVARVSPVPVVRVPLSLPEHLPTKPLNRSHFGLPEKPFLFLFTFDFHSVAERKNPLGLIRAFQKAFRKKDSALLVLKCAHSSAPELQALEAAAAGANVRVIDGVLSREEVNTLLQLSDCYVSLHRSEGFGLTLAEAMSLEKPVIATAYSANTDFMNPNNSFPVNYKLVKLGKDHGPYRKGYVWAEPDLGHAAELMRYVYENPDAARAVGRVARQDILRQLGPAAVGRVIQDRLVTLADFGKAVVKPDTLGDHARPVPPKVKAAVEERQRYQELVRQVRRAAEEALPAGAMVLMVSKGDDDLLRLSGRRAWHFPRAADGTYAGHYPADSAAAIQHLEEQRALGAQFLLLPASALWWLDHYPEFAQHLGEHYARVPSDESCVIYRLAQPTPGILGRFVKRLRSGWGKGKAPASSQGFGMDLLRGRNGA